MDELGLSLTNSKDSEEENFKCVPFIHFKENIDKELEPMSYSLLFPINQSESFSKDLCQTECIANYILCKAGHEVENVYKY